MRVNVVQQFLVSRPLYGGACCAIIIIHGCFEIQSTEDVCMGSATAEARWLVKVLHCQL